jgi:hypothetical protein
MLHRRRFPSSAIVWLCLGSISPSVFRHQGAFSFYLGTDVIAFWQCTAQLMRGTKLLDALKHNGELHVPVPTTWIFKTGNFCMFMQFSELATVISINSMNQFLFEVETQGVFCDLGNESGRIIFYYEVCRNSFISQ